MERADSSRNISGEQLDDQDGIEQEANTEASAAPIRMAQASQGTPGGIDLTKVTQSFTATAGATITLPDGVTLDQIMFVGNNWYIVLENGDLIEIVDAVLFPPNLNVGGILVSSEALLAALEGTVESVPTAGPPVGSPNQSSGINAEVDPGDIGPGAELVDLLLPEALQFFVPVIERREDPLVEEEVESLGPRPPSIGDPQPGFVEEDDLFGQIIGISRDGDQIIQANGGESPPSEPKIGNDLDGSRPLALSFTGNLDVNFNGNAGTVSFLPALHGTTFQDAGGNTLTSNELPVHIHLDGHPSPSQLLIGFTDGAGGTPGVYDPGVDHKIFEVKLTDPVDPSSPGGEYTITVLCNLDHDTPVHNGQDGDTDFIDDGFPTPADEEILGLSFPFVATNSDGTASDSFDVGWQDDMPIIGGESKDDYYEEVMFTPLVDEDPGLPNGIQGGPGDDNGGLTAFGDLNIMWGADHGNSNDPNATFGDRMVILTGLVVRAQDGTILLDGSTNDLKALIPVSFGATELVQATVTIAITTNASQQSVLTGTATAPDGTMYEVFVVTTSDIGSGSFQYTLNHPLVHPFTDSDLQNDGPDTAFEDNLIFTFGFNAKDSDLDTVSGEFVVEVDDDSPAFGAGFYLFSNTMLTHDETEGLQNGPENGD
ncbi:MAG: hypothetical protein OEM91_12355, partial [Hyphomicrobiales bacterium]|nr:hypothetical protein [Hyphomicrobiales bacterium]